MLVTSETPAEKLARFGRALAHPTRVAILNALRTSEAMSPLEIAETIEEPLGSVSYHVRYLADLGVLELERLVPRRGALQHYYKLAAAVNTLLDFAQVAIPDPENGAPGPEAG